MPKEIKFNKGLYDFLIETFEFTDEQLAAIDCQIPMTQEIYNSILNRYAELGLPADDLFDRMLIEYPEFLSNYGQEIEDEVNERCDVPENPRQELNDGWNDLCRRIREKYGKNAI